MRLALILTAALAALPPQGMGFAEFLDRDTITRQLTPRADTRQLTPGAKRSRSLTVLPSVNVDVKFEYDSARLTDMGARQLDELGASLVSEAFKKFAFEVAGHTDAWGTVEYNQRLSERRAEAVKRYLIAHNGIDPERLTTVGWGFRKLQDPADPKNPVNRRVEVKLVQ